MIRRLQHDDLLQSMAPRTLGGGKVLHTIKSDELTPSDTVDAQAYRQGYAEGFQAGEEDGRREAEQYQQAWEQETRKQHEDALQSLVLEHERLAAFVGSLQIQLTAQNDAMEQLAFELALNSLAKVFGSMHEDGELVRRMCTQMAEVYRGKAAKLEVSAVDRAHLPEHVEGLDIAVEHGLSTGECRIVTERGYAESAIATRLDAIHAAMLEALGIRRV